MRLKRTRMTLAVVVLAALAAGLAGCARPQAAQPAAEAPAPSGPRPGGTLVIGRPTDAISLDPNLKTTAPGAWVYVNVLEPLISVNHDMEIVPVLAEDWEFVEPTRVRFTLRKGVQFHDGTLFNAEAVKFNFDRAFNAEPRARWAALAGPIVGAEVVDEDTVDVVFAQPYGPALRALSMAYVMMVSPAAVQKYGDDFGRNPVGTGPFKFVEWKTNDRITLERNEAYWGQKPYLDRVVFRVIPEEGARMLALRTGDVQMVLQPAPAEVEALRQDPAYAVHEATGLRVVFTGFNLAMDPVGDVRMRRAIAHAVDRQAILDHILEGAADPARGIISPGVFGFADVGVDAAYRYDPARARQLLAELGYTATDAEGYLTKNGQRLTLKFLGFRGRYLKDGEIIEALQAQLKEVGIELKVDFLEWGAAFQQIRAAEMPYHMYLFGWVTTNADADYTLYGLFHSSGKPPDGWNRFRYENPEVDRLLVQARTSLDEAERQRLYAQVQEILLADTVAIPIYNTREIAVTTADVEGFRMHPVEYNLFLKDVWLDQP